MSGKYFLPLYWIFQLHEKDLYRTNAFHFNTFQFIFFLLQIMHVLSSPRMLA